MMKPSIFAFGLEKVMRVFATALGVGLAAGALAQNFGPPVIDRPLNDLAYQITFQASDRTLLDADATKARERIVARLQNEIGAQVRGA